MGKKLFGLTASAVAWIVLLCPPPFPASGGGIGASTAWAAEEFSYHDDEILFHFSQEKNLVHFNMLIGMLTDLWREQKRFYDAKGTGENTSASKAEELLNDASLAASQGNYDEAFDILKSAYDIIKASLTEMGIKAEK